MIKWRRGRSKANSQRVLVKHQFAGCRYGSGSRCWSRLPVAAAVGWIVLVLLEIPVALVGPAARTQWISPTGALSPAPAWLLAGNVCSTGSLSAICGMPLLQRHYYFQFASVALIISVNWIFWRVIQWSLRRVRNRALARGHAGTGSLMLLGERILKASFSCWAFCRAQQPGLQHEHGARRTRHRRPGHWLWRAEDDRKSFRRRLCPGRRSHSRGRCLPLRRSHRASSKTSACAPPACAPKSARFSPFPTAPLPRSTWRISAGATRFSSKRILDSDLKAKPIMFASCSPKSAACSTATPKSRPTTVRVRLIDISGASHIIELMSYVLTQDFNEFAAVREDLLAAHDGHHGRFRRWSGPPFADALSKPRFRRPRKKKRRTPSKKSRNCATENSCPSPTFTRKISLRSKDRSNILSRILPYETN